MTPSSSSRRVNKKPRHGMLPVSSTGTSSTEMMGLMRELSNFARETIQAKDQLIQFLMTQQQRSSGPAEV